MFDVPVSAETDLAETASRPLASVQAGIRSLAHWLNWKCGLGDLAARDFE